MISPNITRRQTQRSIPLSDRHELVKGTDGAWSVRDIHEPETARAWRCGAVSGIVAVSFVGAGAVALAAAVAFVRRHTRAS